MAISVTLPQMGESVVEGTIERWLVAEGDRVEKDQNLCEITTDKVDAEIPAPEAGVVTSILVPEGSTVDVGTEIAVIDPSADAAASAPARKPAAAAKPAQAPKTTEATAPSEPTSGEAPRVSPLARRLAEQEGVDLREIAASRERRLTRDDLVEHVRGRAGPRVEAGADAAASTPKAPAPNSLLEFLSRFRVPTYRVREGDREVPFSAVRRRVAEHMVVSKIVSPHVGTVAEIDLHKVVALRASAKVDFERDHGFGLSYLPFIVAATVRALREFPRMNASVVGETIVERNGIHIGVAVETERGLLVPVIRDADRLSLAGIAEAIQHLATRARDREITADELSGGTFTVTNPGRRGNLYGFAVINQPQVGILRIGELVKRPIVVGRDGEDTIAIHPMMHLALSYDHRVIDGVTGNGFLYRVGELLEAGDFEV